MSSFQNDTAHFAGLTEKQTATARLLAEGFTAKEIAARLTISESAATKRIEALRQKFGGITKNELARLAREEFSGSPSSHTVKVFEKNRDFSRAPDGEKLTWKNFDLPNTDGFRNSMPRNRPETELNFSDGFTLDATPPWRARREERLVPEVLDGEHAAPARWAYVVGAAIGMAILLLVLLAVADALGNLA
ncbi:response regulator transcription factor [Aurantiacibacter rhizosphaerae]|uniref:HTH luxR-type domain-containing protein n=1 Tax=Aurantiacibacter rhizosphaerae TaxID=2691582 RepID=A0A844XBK9_9SPHN|nr:helix-turn-helix transcriptional regulator [Aurantiacibacter rhizosphaerae]MWV27008.1 hypothetical protein [Aurantiacibacter rhizosphaerae]